LPGAEPGGPHIIRSQNLKVQATVVSSTGQDVHTGKLMTPAQSCECSVVVDLFHVLPPLHSTQLSNQHLPWFAEHDIPMTNASMKQRFITELSRPLVAVSGALDPACSKPAAAAKRRGRCPAPG
jgi:hypothetical protein